MKLNQKGLSLPEILISLGVMGAIGMGVGTLVSQSAKKKSELDNRMNRMTIEKQIENYFYSDDGCSSLKGKAIGSTVTLDPKKFPQKLGKTEMFQLRISGFAPSDDKGVHGIAKLSLTLKEKGLPQGTHNYGASSAPQASSNDRNFIKEIPIPVNVKTVGGSQIIEDCRLNKTQAFSDIVKRICEGTFGSMTQGLSCADAIALVEAKIIKEICADIYGDKSAQFNSIHCDVNQIHANQSCAGQVAVGFDLSGKIICKSVPIAGAAGPGPADPGPENKACSSWTDWAPLQDETCTGQNVTQKRTCNDTGVVDTQSVPGTKACGTCPADTTYCENKMAGGASNQNFQWGYLTYGPAPACTPKKQFVGGKVVNLADPDVVADCPAPFGQESGCPDPSTYCKGFPTGSGGVVYRWGNVKYGSAPGCKKTEEQVGSYHFTGSELKSGVTEGCPAPYGTSNIE